MESPDVCYLLSRKMGMMIGCKHLEHECKMSRKQQTVEDYIMENLK